MGIKNELSSKFKLYIYTMTWKTMFLPDTLSSSVLSIVKLEILISIFSVDTVHLRKCPCSVWTPLNIKEELNKDGNNAFLKWPFIL